MNVLITGGTGFVGSKLAEILKQEYDHVYILTRSERTSEHPYVHYVKYDPDHPEDDAWMEEMPLKVDVIFNLAGASLQEKWTDQHKEDIYNSRIDVTRMLRRYASQAEVTPGVLVNASAIGYYPVSKSVRYTEADTFAAHDFLSTVVTAWENEARRFEDLGVRVVCARFGLILDSEEGALPKMSIPYRLGAGGPLGSGEQWYSWIHIDDVLNALLYTAVHSNIRGPVNMTAPMPLRQKQFSKYLSSALGRPDFFKTPAFLIRKVLGEQSILILKGQYVLPEVLMENDFKFVFPTLEIALENIFDLEDKKKTVAD
ncbi:TIGR01777 family oxidoreductase [Salinicoccus hispanicus]|uniref:TIGR01777 family protein n=1 Tax=Salinicoccus hispanicus TaxID=157225 RepID=A0A6N8U3H8_9STAP|nr:TIGR01777 family oxidoreductase [Salinicoccus hispanicus]MXQ50751.1 TIGR01777 family protein [Salinicoccus hispanicus]